MLARSTVDRVSARRGDTDWLAAAWADPAARVLILDNARALVRFGDKEAELILVPTAEAPEGLRFLLGVDDAEVAYFGVMGPPGCLESVADPETTDDHAPTEGAAATAPARHRRRRERQRTGRRRTGQLRRRPERPGTGAAAEAPEQQTVTEQAAWLARAKPGLRAADLREAAALLNDRERSKVWLRS